MATSGQHTRGQTRKAKPGASAIAAALIDSSHDGVVVFDRAGRITVWSPAAAAITGVAVEDVVGRSLARKLPWLARADGGKPLAATLLTDALEALDHGFLDLRCRGPVAHVQRQVRPLAAADPWHYLDVVASDGLVLNNVHG